MSLYFHFLPPVFLLKHPRESQPVVSREDPQCMEQHPDSIALEMITDAEAEPFLALSDVESHRRSAEYKGTKKQLEEPFGGRWSLNVGEIMIA